MHMKHPRAPLAMPGQVPRHLRICTDHNAHRRIMAISFRASWRMARAPRCVWRRPRPIRPYMPDRPQHGKALARRRAGPWHRLEAGRAGPCHSPLPLYSTNQNQTRRAEYKGAGPYNRAGTIPSTRARVVCSGIGPNLNYSTALSLWYAVHGIEATYPPPTWEAAACLGSQMPAPLPGDNARRYSAHGHVPHYAIRAADLRVVRLKVLVAFSKKTIAKVSNTMKVLLPATRSPRVRHVACR